MKRFNLFAVLAAIIFTFSSFAQDKVGGNEPFGTFYTQSPTGNTDNPMQTSTQPQEQQFTTEKQSLLNQLRAARLNNDVVNAQQIQTRLNEIDGLTPSIQPENTNPSNNPIQQRFVNMETRAPFTNESDYMVSNIQGGGNWAVATATSQRSATIYAAVTEYVNGGADLVKIYASYNGGATWVLKYNYTGFATGV
ncbi:MAG: hypothetical protein ABI543_11820, partial [Ignavibacteria bacterium]